MLDPGVGIVGEGSERALLVGWVRRMRDGALADALADYYTIVGTSCWSERALLVRWVRRMRGRGMERGEV